MMLNLQKFLETKSDIDSFRADNLITVSIARPTNADHIVNCPFIDPFQGTTKRINYLTKDLFYN